MLNPTPFSLALSGKGDLMDPFLAAARRRFPRMKLYDRNEEKARPPSNAPIPRHPKVADIDVIFHRNGTLETVTVRSAHRHRFFNYCVSDAESDPTRKSLLLGQMTQAVHDLLIAMTQLPTPDVEPPDADTDDRPAEE